MDYYKILEVSRNCTRDELHRAFRRLSKQAHPDRFPESDRQTAEKRYQTIVVAFNTLKDKKLKAKYDKTLAMAGGNRPSPPPVSDNPRENAERFYRNGVAKYQGGQYEVALDCFKKALYYQETAESWYYKGMAESHLSGHGKDAVGSMEKALSLNSKNPKYHLELVRIFDKFGLKTRAKAALGRAMTQFPQNPEVMKLAHEIDPEQVKKDGLFGKGGILGGLFGKK